MDRRYFSFSLLGSIAVAPLVRAEPHYQSVVQEDDCEIVFPADKFRSLCDFIAGRLPAAVGSHDYFSYQGKVYDVGKVTRKDSYDTLRKKVQHLFILNQSIASCDVPTFNVPNGSMLKFAVQSRFDDFIYEAVDSWGVPLNGIDQSDGRTVLDYIDSEISRSNGSPTVRKLINYREIFRKAGARTTRELAITPDNFVDPYDREIVPLKSSWEKVCYVSENRQAVKRGGLWGYLAESGRLAIEPRFQAAFGFSEGRAPVALDGRWGFIDPAGGMVVPAQYRDVRAYFDGQAEVTMDGRTWAPISKSRL